MKKILCVTLDADVRREIELISEASTDNEVTYATSVSEIFLWTASIRFDVFVLDARVLGEGSSHLYSTVRNLDGHGLVICLAASEDDRQRSLDAGADIFLLMPAQAAEIGRVINSDHPNAD